MANRPLPYKSTGKAIAGTSTTPHKNAKSLHFPYFLAFLHSLQKIAKQLQARCFRQIGFAWYFRRPIRMGMLGQYSV
jgi:hypothetical protein